MSGLTDIASRDDLYRLLSRFYGRALVDELLEDPFEEVRAMGLEAHLPVMCDFWETLLFGAPSYRGSPLPVHLAVHDRHPLNGAHFVRWLTLWQSTVDEMFAGPVAEATKANGRRIAWNMHRRLTGRDAAELDALVGV
ncbi:group III truncated hemoglobin [Mycolicibacterium fallax]|uniref:Cyanoglobin n=1 Tax=Mycolicibacterium fallax TaxID=1793 RepID=A0A1X1RMI4_MYCFA|nr:group III truncated hemoglobin [Mycolicibacterium fallax]ORV09692.1 cyanoglobin [Mycolicibacterium fallax]BBZ00406.1 hypothetical protein MFAL_38720 [Mycolicibacterium fallax]HOW93921.1 group III truncated hemoglobin [Mycolicibacterium fallax]HSA39853.1 group III truncated hemoglobin [Mycobacterium sp.]